MLLIVCICVVSAKSYNIVGIYHDTLEKWPQNYKVITDDDRIAKVTMTLMPALIRETTYDVLATRVAENVYRIDSNAFHAELYIEVENCNKKADGKSAIMVIENNKASIKGKLSFK